MALSSVIRAGGGPCLKRSKSVSITSVPIEVNDRSDAPVTSAINGLFLDFQ